MTTSTQLLTCCILSFYLQVQAIDLEFLSHEPKSLFVVSNRMSFKLLDILDIASFKKIVLRKHCR